VIPCRDEKQFLAGSTRKSGNFTPSPVRNSGVLEAYIAGSANWKLSLAASSKHAICSSWLVAISGEEHAASAI
jgi:hypothetical protein